MARELLELHGRVGDAAALAVADAALRIGLAAAWLAAGAATPLLPVCALLVLADAWPRAAIAAGAAATLLAGLPLSQTLALLAAAAARLTLLVGPSAELLREIRGLRRERARALLLTELRRAGGDLGGAGDAFERAGRARSRLSALGIEDRLVPTAARHLARASARLLPLRWRELAAERLAREGAGA
jgi:hypothetical protein